MKSKVIKISLLIPLFFWGLPWGCGSRISINESFYKLQEVTINMENKGQCWRTIQLTLNVEGLYDRTLKIAKNTEKNNGNYANASTMAFTSKLKFSKKIKSYNLKILNSKEDLSPSIKTDLEQEFSEYFTMINDGFAPQDKNIVIKNPVTIGKDTLSVPRVFYFKEEPLFFKGKDVQVEFSIKTEDGEIFADTTKVINIEW